MRSGWEQIGAYKITALLGAGGMGEVYRLRTRGSAHRLGEGIAGGAGSDKSDCMAFCERLGCSALDHADVAHILGIGRFDGVHFVAMEYVEGESLAQKCVGSLSPWGKFSISASKPPTPWRRRAGKESLIVTSSPRT